MRGRLLASLRLLGVIALLLCFPTFATAKKKPPSHPININTASSSELQQVPGIGPSTAQKILDTRKSYGSFKSVDDLLAIRGIGAKRLDKMRKYLTVGKGAPAKKPGAARSASAAKPPPGKAERPKPAKKPDPATAGEDEEP